MPSYANAPTLRAILPALLCLTLAACGDDGGDGAPADSASLGTCGVRADVTGGTIIHFTGKDDAACATQHSFDSGLDVSFLGTSAKGTLELSIEDVVEGETGDDYPTRVIVRSPANESWQGAACLVSISEHRLRDVEASEIGELRHYQVSGEGTCADPLASVAAATPVTLGPFTFRAQFTWRD
jgi:hypothetical protein